MKTINQDRTLIKSRINKLIKSLYNGVYERENTIRLCLLAALSGESVFLLGPPGIAKSLIAKRLIQAFDKASFFDYLMTRFSTPEEVFGPLSIQELKDNGNYVRLTEGYLPTADVVFLDEIWKAGPAILNTLLTVVNEKTFKNGQTVKPIPMRLLITASNELPDADSGLDALYDRLLIRVFIKKIQEKKNFKAMLMGEGKLQEIPKELTIKQDEFEFWQSDINSVSLSEAVFEKIYLLKLAIEKSDVKDLYVSDRRWKKSVRLLKAAAYFNGRDEVNPLDILILKDCLWNSTESLVEVKRIIEEFATTQAFDQRNADHQMNASLVKINNTTDQMLTQLKTQTHTETGLRKTSVTFNIKKAKRYTKNANSRMIKLALLQVNQSVSPIHSGDSEFVFVDGEELVKKMEQGSCEVYGYVNRHPKICPLKFEIDGHQHLVIKDISNRNIFVSIVNEGEEQVSEQASWQTQVDDALTDLTSAQQFLKQSERDFHVAVPHNFLDDSLLFMIDKSLQEEMKKVEKQETEIKEKSQRIVNIPKYFE